MKAAAQRWIAVNVTGLSLIMTTGVASAVEVTDADRAFRNFTRETATVSEGQVRVEVRGLEVQDEEHTRLNTIGILQPRDAVKSVDGWAIFPSIFPCRQCPSRSVWSWPARLLESTTAV